MKALAIIRAEKGLTGKRLSELSGVRREEISRIEHGHFAPRADTMKKLADALGVSARDIYLLQEELDSPKAEPRTTAADWLQQQAGHSYLAQSETEAAAVVRGASSIDDVQDLKEGVDIERDIIRSYLEDHQVEPELRAALEQAVRTHLFWLSALSRRRAELRGKQAGDDPVMVFAMTE